MNTKANQEAPARGPIVFINLLRVVSTREAGVYVTGDSEAGEFIAPMTSTHARRLARDLEAAAAAYDQYMARTQPGAACPEEFPGARPATAVPVKTH